MIFLTCRDVRDVPKLESSEFEYFLEMAASMEKYVHFPELMGGNDAVYALSTLSKEQLVQFNNAGLFQKATWFLNARYLPFAKKLRLRLDSKLFFYNQTSEGFGISEAYAIKGLNLA